MGKGGMVGSPQMPAGPLAQGLLRQGSEQLEGLPVGILRGFVPGCRAVCGLSGIGKGGGNPASLHLQCCYACQGAPSPGTAAVLSRDGLLGSGAEGVGSGICPGMFIGNSQM